MLLVLRNQKIGGVLWDGDFSDRIFCFRSCYIGLACVVSSCLLADGDGPVFDIQIRPLERYQFALAQTTDELQIEHRQNASLICRCQVRSDLFWRQDLHLVLWNFGRYTVVCRIAHDQAFFNRAVEGIVQHRVDAANRRVAQSRLLAFLRFAEPPVFL